MRKLVLVATLSVACSSARFHPRLVRGFYPGPITFLDKKTHEPDAWFAADHYIYPLWHELEDSLGFNIEQMEYRGTGMDGQKRIFRFFAPAIGDILHKQHSIFAGAFIQLVLEQDTPRVIYFKELPWE